jgi:Cu(I)/Ag(I) efflux system membrane protein CusA/SilA
MRGIAAPMVGGMITATLLSMFVIPAAYSLIRRPRQVRTPGVRLWKRPDAPA